MHQTRSFGRLLYPVQKHILSKHSWKTVTIISSKLVGEYRSSMHF